LNLFNWNSLFLQRIRHMCKASLDSQCLTSLVHLLVPSPGDLCPQQLVNEDLAYGCKHQFSTCSDISRVSCTNNGVSCYGSCKLSSRPMFFLFILCACVVLGFGPRASRLLGRHSSASSPLFLCILRHGLLFCQGL
jgi:hypothetical protein